VLRLPFEGSFAMMPIGIHSLFYYILYFSAGIVAKRNDWLTEMMKAQMEGRKEVAASLFLWGVIAFITVSAIVFTVSVESAQPGSADQNTAIQSLGMYNFFIGFFAVIICLAELKLFHAYFNKSGRVSKFFCESAYAAYIIHYMFINLGYYVYFRLLMQFSGLPADTFEIWQVGEQDTRFLFLTNHDGVTAGEGEKYTWFGMMFVIAFANLCTWPTAYVLHKLPLFNQVL